MVVAAAVALVGCGQPTSDSGVLGGNENPEETVTPSEPESGEERGPDSLEAPPPVTIHFDGKSAELEAWTFCYGNGCADGAPPEDLVDVASPDEVIVEFPLDGWRFDATFTPSGEKCGRNINTSAEPLDDGRFVLRPVGHAGTYDVTLFGRGDGDLFVTFRWTTPSDGPLPKPEARLAVLAGHDGEADSYGIELALENLARTPSDAEATITVTASGGESLTFAAEQATGGCWPEGTVYWDDPDDRGLAAAKLGEAPFTYEVEVVLDGKAYRAQAVWPDDMIKGNEPSVSLDFSPALPAMQ
jgi:hypothetical protein